MRDQMLPRVPLPQPDKEQDKRKALEVMPNAVPEAATK
jgi:hypothetical protein